MKKGHIGVMERYAEIESLARLIYQTHGATVGDSFPKNYMRDSKEHRERSCYVIATRIIDRYLR